MMLFEGFTPVFSGAVARLADADAARAIFAMI
jgi:hypothetical protein